MQQVFHSRSLRLKIILICSHPPDFSGLAWKIEQIPDKEICEVKLQFVTFWSPSLRWTLLTPEKSATSFLSCSWVSGHPISWSGRLIPASPTLWPLCSRCNCLRAWWTSVSDADDVSLQLVITARRPPPPWPPQSPCQEHVNVGGKGSSHLLRK